MVRFGVGLVTGLVVGFFLGRRQCYNNRTSPDRNKRPKTPNTTTPKTTTPKTMTPKTTTPKTTSSTPKSNYYIE